MLITKIFPDLEKPPPVGQWVNHTCPLCESKIVIEVGENCPEDWLCGLLKITGCDECSSSARRQQRAAENEIQAKVTLSMKEKALRLAMREISSADYKTRSSAQDRVALLEIEISKLKQSLNLLKNSRHERRTQPERN